MAVSRRIGSESAASRRELLDAIAGLRRREEMTIVLTTHYLEEAESLCDDIALIARGEIIARDSAANLKRQFGAATLEEVYLRTVSARPAEVGAPGPEPARG